MQIEKSLVTTEIASAEALLEGSMPCTPEQIQQGDIVVALLCLGTRLAIRYIFEHQAPPEGEELARLASNLQIFPAMSQNADQDQRRALCEEACDDLEARFRGKMGMSALNVLRTMIATVVLDVEDPCRPPDLSEYPPHVVTGELASFLIMDLRHFDKLGRMIQ